MPDSTTSAITTTSEPSDSTTLESTTENSDRTTWTTEQSTSTYLPETTTLDTTTLDTTTPEPTTTVPPPTSTPDPDRPEWCPKKNAKICNRNDNLQYYPHPHDCGKFIHCDGEKAYKKSCPSGLLWNQENMVCDWPRNVICCNEHDPFRCPPQKSLKNICDDGELFHPHPYSCAHHVVCHQDKPTVIKCHSGLLWNVRDEKCDWPRNVRCCSYHIYS